MAEIMERPGPPGVGAREFARRLFRHENAVRSVVLIALICGMAILTKGIAIRPDNVMNNLLQTSAKGVAAIGQAFVILTGGIDLSVAKAGLVVCVIGASMVTETAYLNIVGHPVSAYLAVPVMLLLGAGLGAVNGLLVSRIGIPSLIATLGMSTICFGLAFRIRGGSNISHFLDSFLVLGQGRVAGVPIPLIVFIVVVVVAYIILNHTSFGRCIYAVGGNPVSSRLAGIRVENILLAVFVVSGVLTGLAATMTTARTAVISMRSLEGLELDTIASVCLGGFSLMGGRGNIIGVVLGTLILAVIGNGLSVLRAGPFSQDMVRGAVIMIAVAIDCIRSRR